MIRDGFPGAKDRPALRAVMRRPSESHGVARRQSHPARGWPRKGDKGVLKRTSGRPRLNLHAALNLEN